MRNTGIAFTLVVFLAFSSMSQCQGEIVEVQAYATPTAYSSTLIDGQWYQLEVSGTYIWWGTGQTPADAEWYEAPSTAEDPYIPGVWYDNQPDNLLDLLINETGVNWLGCGDIVITDDSVFSADTYSPSHIYRYDWLGTEEQIALRISDGSGANIYDNSGYLTVAITPIPEPATLLLFGLGVLALRRKRRA